MRCRNKPSDGGNFILTEAAKKQLLAVEPAAAKKLHQALQRPRRVSILQCNMRWCLWLAERQRRAEIRALCLKLCRRVEAFRRSFRLASKEHRRDHGQGGASQPPSVFIRLVSRPSLRFIAYTGSHTSEIRRTTSRIGQPLAEHTLFSNKMLQSYAEALSIWHLRRYLVLDKSTWQWVRHDWGGRLET